MIKLYDEYDTVFKNGDLTHLMITKKGERNKIPKHLSYPLYKLLKSFLADYGIFIGGAVHIGDYEVTAVTIDANFDIENEPILRELYAFTGGTVNIQLSTKLAQDCAFAFNYDLKDYTCTWFKYVHGDEKECFEFTTLAELLDYLRKREAENE